MFRARPVGVWERGLKWARRRKALAALLAVCLFVAGAAAKAWNRPVVEIDPRSLESRIRQLERASLRRNIGVVLQDSFLFAGTIRDNITFGHKEKAMQRVKLVCSRLGIDVSRPEEIDLSPADLKGRRAIVEATVEEYDQVVLDKETKQPVTDPVTGQTKTRRAQRNAVPFAGYEPYGATAGGGSRGPVGAASGGESGLSEERLPF